MFEKRVRVRESVVKYYVMRRDRCSRVQIFVEVEKKRSATEGNR